LPGGSAIETIDGGELERLTSRESSARPDATCFAPGADLGGGLAGIVERPAAATSPFNPKKGVARVVPERRRLSISPMKFPRPVTGKSLKTAGTVSVVGRAARRLRRSTHVELVLVREAH